MSDNPTPRILQRAKERDDANWSGFKWGVVCGIPIGMVALLLIIWFAISIVAPALEMWMRFGLDAIWREVKDAI